MRNRVKELRERAGLSQEELAKLCKIPRTTLSAIEREMVVPSVSHAIRIARALGCSVEELFPQEEVLRVSPTLREGTTFVAGYVGESIVLHPSFSSFVGHLIPDGVLKEGEPRFFNRGYLHKTIFFAGCDPLFSSLHHSFKEKGYRVVPYHANNTEALYLLKEGFLHVAGVHLGTYQETLEMLKEKVGRGFLVLSAYAWKEGIISRDPVESLQEVKRGVWLVREKGSGVRDVFDRYIEAKVYREVRGTHWDMANLIFNGLGDYTVVPLSVALERGLSFYSLRESDYVLVIREDTDPLFVKSLREELKKLTGMALLPLGYTPKRKVEEVVL
ncbi:transcriptional regulator of molybdate metabolism, XRE family [Thermocrinis albus DSM 14484]|uniref:Transcriptional regulator of molybdate metabolism, XRE family n=1 Tax=Thermocrinis albus (strain DSM 14484 / JCM 11386 / HI 11/12) TaxID=638303 RepID=D3SNB9_THEAH|nr:substrate-binding domain-containing protein [Thermocrinis albus]ADC88656.1 transcriptional regulator of molybdate metabolism, XRE family [Thermocrinis albus DSM 14484]